MEKNNINDKNKYILYLVIFFVGCLSMWGLVRLTPVVSTTTESVTKVKKDVTVNEYGIADAVEKVYDAVVVVSTYKNQNYVAAGTGFIYKKDGNKYYILTNNHVVENGNKVSVTFTNGSVLETTVIGTDAYSDIAVLKVETKDDLTVAELGKSEESRVGDTSFAVGAPLASTYSWTVTRGIISGKDRLVEVSVGNSLSNNYVMKVVQTDAAINSGNSGGPLCNSNGQVIGITSLKLVSSGIEGMGFAIPIEDALKKAEEIISNKNVERPLLGIDMLDISQAYYSYKYYDLIRDANISRGVIVSLVDKNSGADKAGIKENDIIIKIDGNDIKNSAFLRYYLFQHSVGDSIKVTVIRDKKEVTVDVKLGSNKKVS